MLASKKTWIFVISGELEILSVKILLIDKTNQPDLYNAD